MKPERYRQIDQIFQAALSRDVAARVAFLDEVCTDDAKLRSEVEALLASDEQAGSFIESPALEMAPELIAEAGSTTVSGKSIGPYRLDQRLGAGGMGKVYLAHDIRLGRKVALKLLDPRLLDDTEQRTRFLREARLASVLDHPNICTIHQVGEAQGRLFIAMQYVEGQTLKQLINGRPLSLDCVLSISLQVADALSAAHAQGIIHRDIKSGNIIVTPHGQAKVLDFGLAKLLEREQEQAETEVTIAGEVMGTPSFMSPEQALGERVDHRSDIFSFAIVMYEMATGHLPFSSKSRAGVISAVLSQPHTPAAQLNKGIPANLSAVIDRALAKEPANRYQSVQEMLADLRQVVAEAGGLDHLFNSSESQFSVMTPYFVPRQTLSRMFGRRIERPFMLSSLAVGVVLIILGLTAAYYWPKSTQPPTANQAESPASSAQIKSIAVLPFKPLAVNIRDESLELGMADTLITRLSNLREIVVRPTSAVRTYAQLEQDAVAAGRELKVDAVLDGSIQRTGERVRVTARLVRVEDGAPLWAETFNEKLTDIFAVQDRVSEKVAGLLAVKLTGQEQILLTKRYTENSEAYQLYLKGRYLWNQRTEPALKKSIEYFERAIEIDPQYAPAYVGIADSHGNLLGWSNVLPDESYPRAKAAALKALELDDNLAEAHAALAQIKIYYEWDWSGVERECKRAIALNPNYATAHQYYAKYLWITGRFDEALAEVKAAQRLDPLSIIMRTDEGQTLYYARRYDEAVEKLRETLEMDQHFMRAHVVLGATFVMKGMYEEAISEYLRAGIANVGSPESAVRSAAAHREAYATSGERGYWRHWLDWFTDQAKGRPILQYDRARCYVFLGDKDQAFAWFEKAYQHKEAELATLRVDPTLDSIRSDPRFQDLLRRVGLAP